MKEGVESLGIDEEKEEEEEGDEEVDVTLARDFNLDQYNPSSDSSFDSYNHCSETVMSEENLDSSYDSDDTLGSDRILDLSPCRARHGSSSSESDFDWDTDDKMETLVQPKRLWYQSKSLVALFY